MFYRNLVIVFVILIAPGSLLAQNRDVTVQDVWRGTFYARSTSGLRSMNDGLHFTVLNGADGSIDKYSYDHVRGLYSNFFVD